MPTWHFGEASDTNALGICVQVLVPNLVVMPDGAVVHPSHIISTIAKFAVAAGVISPELGDVAVTGPPLASVLLLSNVIVKASRAPRRPI
jgi:hypothetical protein